MQPERKIIHDIRNCLNALILNSGYLEAFAPNEIAESMEAIGVSADQICKLLNQLEGLRGDIELVEHDFVPLIPPEALGELDSTINPKM